MKSIFSLLIIVGFILVTFFGLGPVMLADGSTSERIATLVIVILVYVILAILFRRIRKIK